MHFRIVTCPLSYPMCPVVTPLFEANVIPDGAREGMLAFLDAIKATHARARTSDEVLRPMDLPRFRNGYYGVVKFLQRNDKNDFEVRDWTETIPGILQVGLVELIAQLTEMMQRMIRFMKSLPESGGSLKTTRSV